MPHYWTEPVLFDSCFAIVAALSPVVFSGPRLFYYVWDKVIFKILDRVAPSVTRYWFETIFTKFVEHFQHGKELIKHVVA